MSPDAELVQFEQKAVAPDGVEGFLEIKENSDSGVKAVEAGENRVGEGSKGVDGGMRSAET